jgi:hypothetical protein
VRAEAIYQFLEVLGVNQIDMTTDGKWINTRCPLAPYTHAGGVDTHPSFGISINDEDTSIWYCFGCSPKAKPLGHLLHMLWILDGRYPKEAARVYLHGEMFQERLDDSTTLILPKDRWKREAPKHAVKSLPPKVLKRYPLLQRQQDFEARRIREWLEIQRGVPEYIQNFYRLRYHYDSQSVVFPLTDKFGGIFLLRERLRKEKRIWTINPELARFPEMEFPKLSQVGVWFGMEVINWSNMVMLVEGEIDVLRLASLGFRNAIASCTSSVTDAQISTLTADTLILGFDADKAGNLASHRVIERVQGKAALYYADWTLALKEDGTPCKDPGDLPNRDAFLAVMENLEEITTKK